jgi:hypothetical protein
MAITNVYNLSFNDGTAFFNQTTADRNEVQFMTGIPFLAPKNAQLLTLGLKPNVYYGDQYNKQVSVEFGGMERENGNTYFWSEDAATSPIITLNAAITVNNQTTFSILGTSSIQYNDLFKIQSVDTNQEVVRVINSTVLGNNVTSITVQRGAMGTTALASVASGTKLFRVGTASTQGRSIGINAESYVVPATPVSGYCQLFDIVGSINNSAMATTQYGMQEIQRIMRAKEIELYLRIESAMLFGQLARDSTNNLFYTEGLISAVRNRPGSPNNYVSTTNYSDLTIDELNAFVDDNALFFGSDEKFALCTSGLLRRLTAIYNTNGGIQREQVSDPGTYGISCFKLRFPNGGTLLLSPHLKLTENANSSPTNIGVPHMVVVDPEAFKTVVFRDLTMTQNIQTGADDFTAFKILGELGTKISQVQRHAVMNLQNS